MKFRALALVAVALALAAGAADAKKRVNYADYAGEPVSKFRYSQLYNWQRSDNRSMVVWTKPSEAYLLTFANDCSQMSGRYQIQIGGVASIGGFVRAGDDVLIPGQMSCRIAEIRPIDLVRLKKA
ncbi:DUF6491 family protein [Arenimonas sp.]|uniref:DUF6491 family protein n=1 Tax=Arenimonas sp. TaxID=1872635 RepID=UPI0039E4E3AA